MLPILRDSPFDAFKKGSFEAGISAHRWEKYVVPEGTTVQDMERGADGRLLREVPGDGNVYDHQLAQERLIREYGELDIGSETLVRTGFSKVKPVSKTDFFRLRIAALVHDVAEIEHGDTVYDDKHTATHTVRDEIESTRKFVRKSLDEFDPRRKRRLERSVMASYSIDHDKSHRLHGIFKLYEKYSYVNGAIAIYGNGEGSIAHPHWAVHNVFKNQIDVLVRAAEEGIPSSVAFLRDRMETITAMFAWVCASGFEDPVSANQAAFEEAKASWTRYLSNAPMAQDSERSAHDFGTVAKTSQRRRSR